jgi:DNA-directed RNA polymerase sigma subunit (sigma70/sigma32)
MPAPDPSADDIAAFRRRAADLLRRQRAGQVPPPGQISADRLARELGLSRRRLRQIEARALHKLRQALTPDLQP